MGGGKIVFIAGPCVVENRDITMRVAEKIRKVGEKLGVRMIFKSSYAKANRTSGSSFASLGMDESLRILGEVKEATGLPLLTDIHTESEAAIVAQVVDVLQIPAFLCRQTDLLRAAAKTGLPVNIKKGQFLAPEEMRHAAAKIINEGNSRVMLTERGTTFGYHNLVVDMRSLPVMRSLGYPVILDATHSVQLPGGSGNETGGQPQFIFPIARAGAAVGIDGLFVETHPDPPKAKSDAASQLKLSLFERLVSEVSRIDELVKEGLGV